jgi:hypothetical protein
MAGLVPAIHAVPLRKKLSRWRKLNRVDARHKAGHDASRAWPFLILPTDFAEPHVIASMRPAKIVSSRPQMR